MAEPATDEQIARYQRGEMLFKPFDVWGNALIARIQADGKRIAWLEENQRWHQGQERKRVRQEQEDAERIAALEKARDFVEAEALKGAALVCDQVVAEFRNNELNITDWTGHEAARRIRALVHEKHPVARGEGEVSDGK